MTNATGLLTVDPEKIDKNPNNPRQFFNDEKLDVLRTSMMEVGILVPLIVYPVSGKNDRYVLLDGERRWSCALELAFDEVPVNVIDPPDTLENLLRMFNIHNVREDWPLISVATSLNDIVAQSGETRESRLAQMTGLTRATVRRAKKLMSIPKSELDLIRKEAHLDRPQQIHREDLYIEIVDAESVLRNALPEVASKYTKPQIIRKFAEKREQGSLTSVTEFRYVSRLVDALKNDLVTRQEIVQAAERLINEPTTGPKAVFDDVAALAYEQKAIDRKAELLLVDLRKLDGRILSDTLTGRLRELRTVIGRLLRTDG